MPRGFGGFLEALLLLVLPDRLVKVFCEVEQGQSLKMNRGALREVERFAGTEVGAGRYCYPVVDEVEFCGSLIVCC